MMNLFIKQSHIVILDGVAMQITDAPFVESNQFRNVSTVGGKLHLSKQNSLSLLYPIYPILASLKVLITYNMVSV